MTFAERLQSIQASLDPRRGPNEADLAEVVAEMIGWARRVNIGLDNAGQEIAALYHSLVVVQCLNARLIALSYEIAELIGAGKIAEARDRLADAPEMAEDLGQQPSFLVIGDLRVLAREASW